MRRYPARVTLAALAWLALASLVCGARPVSGSAAPAWVPVQRNLAGAGPWVRAGAAASAALPSTHPTVLFVGDSITQWWTRFGAATWDADFAPLGAVADGVVGDTTSNLLYRLESASLDGLHPRVVVTLIGTDNFHLKQTPAQIAQGIEAVVAVLRRRLPDARIVLLGLLPRNRENSPARRTVKRVNRLLAAAPAVRAGTVTYLDAGAGFLQPDGRLVPGVLHPDLLHPTALGYRILGRALAPVVRSLLRR